MYTLKECLACQRWLDAHELSTVSAVLVQRKKIADTELSLLRENKNLVVETDSLEVVLDCAACGLEAKNIFFRCSGIASNSLAKIMELIQGKCRFLVSSKEEVKLIDAQVEPYLKTGYLETIAIDLKIGSRAEGIFSDNNIADFSRWIKFSRNLAVRSIFVSWEEKIDLAEAARQAFSLIKKIRSDMPCLFTSFCLEGLVEPLMREENSDLLKTLQMLSALNDTSFYANFCIK